MAIPAGHEGVDLLRVAGGILGGVGHLAVDVAAVHTVDDRRRAEAVGNTSQNMRLSSGRPLPAS